MAIRHLFFFTLVLTFTTAVVASKTGMAGPTTHEMPKMIERWQPQTTDRWQWQLSGPVNGGYDVEVYDIDLFDTPAETIADLQSKGKRVICYFSAGSSENWREDFNQFQPQDLGKPLSDWDGEHWLDIRSANVRAIMLKRLDLAGRKGCDGVEPDNMDAYLPDNNSGLTLTADDQLDYHRFLIAAAHARGLAIGQKNDLGHIDALADEYDFAINEQCHAYNECGVYAAFTSRGKPVFNTEYDEKYYKGADHQALCHAAKTAKIRTIIMPLELDDSFRISCDR